MDVFVPQSTHKDYMTKGDIWVSHTPDRTQDTCQGNEEFATAAELPLQRPLSPQTAYEKFFLPLKQEEIVAFARAARSNNNSSRLTTTESVLTDEFASAVDNFSGSSDLDEVSVEEDSPSRIYGSEILRRAHTIPEVPEEEEEQLKSMSTSTVVESPVAPVTGDDPHFDVVGQVYEGAKSAWAFGKGIVVFKPFMGLAEGVAVKVLTMTTGINDLETVDKSIKPHLSTVDSDILDPAILKLWSVIAPVISKGDDTIKSIVGIVTRSSIEVEKEEVVTEEESKEAVIEEEPTPFASVQ